MDPNLGPCLVDLGNSAKPTGFRSASHAVVGHGVAKAKEEVPSASGKGKGGPECDALRDNQ